MHTSTDPTYRHVRVLSRALSILQALNDNGVRGATPSELSTATKINRTTVKRILETLVDDGYVLPCDGEGGYGLAPQVLSLSRGLTDEAGVLQCAGPVLKDINEHTGWSLRFTSLHQGAMVVRDSTHGRSKLASEPTVGVRHTLPVLLTAAGRAYFARCDTTTRAGIVASIRSRKDEQYALASNDRLVELLSRRVLDDGFALNDGDWGGRGTGAIAVPVCAADGRPLASLSLVYQRRTGSMADVLGDFLPELRRGAARIESALAAH